MYHSVGAIEYTDWFSAERQDSQNLSPGYDTKQFDGDAPVMLELWEMRSTPLMLSRWPRMVAPDMVLSIDQIERNCLLMLN